MTGKARTLSFEKFSGFGDLVNTGIPLLRGPTESLVPLRFIVKHFAKR
jgi:hypothetical protein